MTFKNASDFPGLYESMGVKTWGLGCLMIDTEQPYEDIQLAPGDEYVSTNPKNLYVKGLQTAWHVTARYGLLPEVKSEHVFTVLEGYSIPPELSIRGYDMFPSTDPNEPFECVVALVEDPLLDDINAQLSVLPNISTFVEYEPHITIGYFRPGWFEDNWNQFILSENVVGTLGWNWSPARA